jgi:hypothetical protein
LRARWIALGLVVASVFATGSRCGATPDELSRLQSALRSDPGYSLGLVADARSVQYLTELSDEDLALQHRLLLATDQRILAYVSTAMDARASRARSTADAAARLTASAAVVVRQVPPKFVQDLEQVTQDVVQEQACQDVMDQLAAPPDQAGGGQAWPDLVTEVVDRMVTAKGWARPPDQWSRFIDWADYVSGVDQDALQLADALVADPSDIELFARPPIRRAALAYARFCYAPPRLP